jgi:hypothetical protein
VFVILTSKPGEFRTEIGAELRPVESYDYSFCGRMRAHFVIAEITAPTKVRIVDETPPLVVNLVPTKFLEKFATVERARHELESLASSGGTDFVLARVTR